MARKLKFERSINAENPMTRAEVQSADQVMARLIAAVYAADHPELFEGCLCDAHIMREPLLKTLGPNKCGPSKEGILTAGEDDVRVD
jgi:hypothetical protein